MIIQKPLLQRHQDSIYSGKTSIYSIVDSRNYKYGIFLMSPTSRKCGHHWKNIHHQTNQEKTKISTLRRPESSQVQQSYHHMKNFLKKWDETHLLCNTIKWYMVAHQIKCISLRSSFIKTIMQLSTSHPPLSLLLRFQMQYISLQIFISTIYSHTFE